MRFLPSCFMTDNEALNAIVSLLEELVFLAQAGCIGLAWIAGSLMVVGWCYARIDGDF